MSNDMRLTPPEWLRGGMTVLPEPRRRFFPAGYLEKTLAGIERALAEERLQDALARRQGWLQSIDARVKAAGFGAALIGAALSRELPALALLQLLLAAVAVSAGMDLGSYLRRAWLPGLAFAGVAALPALLSWVTPGVTLLHVYHLEHAASLPVWMRDLDITRQGVKTAAFLLLRATASLGLVVLWVRTTPWSRLTGALGALGVPGMVIMVLDLSCRYLFLFLLVMTDYLLGRRSRLAGVEASGERYAWIGQAIAGFARMAGQYAGEVAASMQARGYAGHVPVRDWERLQARDWTFMAAAVLTAIMIAEGGSWIAW